MAKIYNRTATTDQILILGVRQAVVQSFSAPGWTDLRFAGFFSVVKPPTAPPIDPDPNDDSPALVGMPETVTGTQAATNFYFIGLSSQDQTQFVGFTNLDSGLIGNSVLGSSDLALGSSGHYWRAYNSVNFFRSFQFRDNTRTLAQAYPGVSPHFFQNADPGNPAPAGYYCGMLGFRLTRPTRESRVLTAYVPNPSPDSSDMLWTNAPTSANLLAAMDPWPTPVRQVGPVTFTRVPDCLYLFWPFTKSRLRCSAMGILRSA